jgi:hypothetical protein
MCGHELLFGAACTLLGAVLALGGLAAAVLHIARRVVGG